MLTLFHHPLFASCRFVRLAFGEYGEELALIEEKPWTRRKEFLSLNPAGTLPVLLAEGDVPIIGAQVIAEYLDETRGVLKRDKRLFAEDPMERAEIRRLVDWYPDQDGQRSDAASGARARAQADDAGGAGRRLARFGGDPRGARQHPPAHEIHQLAGRHPPLAGRRAHHLCRPCRRRGAFGSRLSRRDRLERAQRGARVVYAAEIAAIASGRCSPTGCAACRRCPTMRTSTSERPDAAANSAAVHRARGEGSPVSTQSRSPRPTLFRSRRARLSEFVAEGFHGSMGMDRRDARAPRRPARAVARGALDHRARDELRAGRTIRATCSTRRDRGAISVYAQNRDYHDVDQGQAEGASPASSARAPAATSRSSSIPRR